MIFDMTEESASLLPKTRVPADSIRRLHRLYGAKVKIDSPGVVDDGHYELRSKGWVGVLPVDEHLTLRINPKVPLKNLFRMWEYAYDLKNPLVFDSTANFGSLQEVYDSLASILANKIMQRIKKGLFRDYVGNSGQFPYVRGRINPVASATKLYRGAIALECEYRENTGDLEENRILARTLFMLSRLPIQKESVRREIAKAFRALAGNVSFFRFRKCEFDAFRYHRLNDDYRPMHGLCRFFLESSGPAIQAGDKETYPFLIHMPGLFEKFVANWLRVNADSHFRILSQFPAPIQGGKDMTFRIDIVLKDKKTDATLAVMDAKYKRDASPSESDIHQIVAYAVRMGAEKAVLVYPSGTTRNISLSVGDINVHVLIFDIGREGLDEQGDVFLKRLLLCR